MGERPERRRVDRPVAAVSVLLLVVAAALIAMAVTTSGASGVEFCGADPTGPGVVDGVDECREVWPWTWPTEDALPLVAGLVIAAAGALGLRWATRRDDPRA